jgi:hypothetical protein
MKIGQTMMTLALFGAVTGCSFIIDAKNDQCQRDADCAHFGGYPSCQAGVCVFSGLGPEGCVIDPPKTQNDYLNACSTSKCVPFDNCERLGICSASTPLPATQDPNNSVIPPLVNPVDPPTVMCSAAGANVIYLFGSADFGPLLKAVQPSLSANNPPYRAVFQNATSCGGVTSVFDATKRLMKDPAMTANGGWAFYFNDQGDQVNCLLDPAGTPIDIGISDLYAQTCNPAYVPGATVAEYLGPVVPFVLSVPSTSLEEAISVEAAHMIFGLGGKAPPGSGLKDATPWNDPNSYSIRNASSASTVLTALLTDVPRNKFWGIDRLSTDNLRDSLLASTTVSASIGILSIDYNDKNRGNLRALYLQSKGQSCGYQPDSSPTTYDKSNVRDGHYPLWGYVHFFTSLGPGGVPSAAASAMVLRFRVPKLEQSLLDKLIDASLIPQCAMKVSRAAEVGEYSAQGGFQCGCYFDQKTKNKTSCQACTISEDCPSSRPACNYGYCELN